jgi:hypothetical protein
MNRLAPSAWAVARVRRGGEGVKILNCLLRHVRPDRLGKIIASMELFNECWSLRL